MPAGSADSLADMLRRMQDQPHTDEAEEDRPDPLAEAELEAADTTDDDAGGNTAGDSDSDGEAALASLHDAEAGDGDDDEAARDPGDALAAAIMDDAEHGDRREPGDDDGTGDDSPPGWDSVAADDAAADEQPAGEEDEGDDAYQDAAAQSDAMADAFAGFGQASASAAAASASARPAGATGRKPASRRSDGGKAVFIPVLLTLGLLMLAPGVWSVLHLTGLYVSEAPNADAMAMFMLVCWPIALFLIGAAIMMMRQLKRKK